MAALLAVLLSTFLGEILYSSTKTPYESRVLVLAHFDKPTWRKACAPLVHSLATTGVDHMIGYLNLSTFPGLARRNAECMRSKECAQVLRTNTFFGMNKVVWLRDLVASGMLHPDAILIAADCSDTYLMCNARELECKYEALGGDLVFGAEYDLWPYDSMYKAVKRGLIPNPYPESPTGIRHGNSGLLIGRTRHIASYFARQRREWETGTPETWCCPLGARYVLPRAVPSNETDCSNDQRCLHTYVAAGFHKDGKGPSVKFDHLAELFLALGRVSNRATTRSDWPRVDFNLSQALAPTVGRHRGQKWRAHKAYTSPCWLHGAGAGKPRFFTVAAELMRLHSQRASGPAHPDAQDAELQRCYGAREVR